jgi:hypothetical protein
LQSASLVATQAASLALHFPCSLHGSEPLQSALEATTQSPRLSAVHLPWRLHSGAVLQESVLSQLAGAARSNAIESEHLQMSKQVLNICALTTAFAAGRYPNPKRVGAWNDRAIRRVSCEKARSALRNAPALLRETRGRVREEGDAVLLGLLARGRFAERTAHATSSLEVGVRGST